MLEWLFSVLPLTYTTDAILAATASDWSTEVGSDLGICLAFGVAFLALAAWTMPRATA